MPVEYFLRYRGQCYDVGTILRFREPYGPVQTGTIKWFSHNCVGILLDSGAEYPLSKTFSLDNVIVEIVNPVYYKMPQKTYASSRKIPSDDNIFIGWVWYIVIMLVGGVFKLRFLVWIAATTVFFAWKNGLLNGGNKK